MITKREIIFSVAIVCVLLIFGFLIAQSIGDDINKKNQEYDCALQIKSKDQFKYAMKTNAGNAFVYGKYISLDPVCSDEVSGEYSYLIKYTERYTQHHRTVTYKDSDGNTKTRTEDYWTWDNIDTECWKSFSCKFLGIRFSALLFRLPHEEYLCTIPAGYHLRHVWYGTQANFIGTIYTNLANNSITETELIVDKTTSQALEHVKSQNSIRLILFWVSWIIVIILVVVGFYVLENEWLE